MGAEDLKKQFEDPDLAYPAIGEDDEYPDLESDAHERFKALTEGSGPYKYQSGDDEVLGHIKARDDLRPKFREHLEREIHKATLAENDAHTANQAKTSRYQMLGDIAKQGLSAGITGQQATIDSTQKGPAEATKSLAGYSNDQVNQAITGGTQNATAIDQQAQALNQAKEKVNSQTQ
jgi:hypothetical protein